MDVNFDTSTLVRTSCTACLKEINKSSVDTVDLVQITYFDLLSKCSEIFRLPTDVVLHFCESCVLQLRSIEKFKQTCVASLMLLEQNVQIPMNIDYNSLDGCKIVDEILQEKISVEDEIFNEVSLESFPPIQETTETVPEKKRSTDARNFCSICLINVPKITKHAVKVHSIFNEDNNLQCTACNKVFACREKFVEHFNFHREYDEPKPCQICGLFFTKRPDFDRHIALHKKSKKQEHRYQCTECEKYFHKRYKLLYHKIKDHEGGFQCRYCPMAFRKEDLDKYNDHMKKEEDRKHTRPSKQKHICAFCGDEKSDSSSLYEHIRRYHNDETFFCNTCSKTFRSKFALKHHHEAVHGESKYECDCGRRFKLKSGLKTHQLTHAPSESCKICGKKLSARYMAHHLKLHSEKQTHMCITCGLVLKSQEQLSTHMQSHGTEILYNCQMCNACYASIDLLRSHYEQNHGYVQDISSTPINSITIMK